MKRIAVNALARNVLNLPRLPIPSLAHTFDTYRYHLRALHPADALTQHLSRLESFLELSAPVLQRHLLDHDQAAAEGGDYPFSYVEHVLDAMQLGSRGPSEVHTNPAFVLKRGVVGAGASQSGVAAALTHAVGCWISEALTNGIAVHNPTLDLSPLLCEFGRCRVPGKDIDSVVTTPMAQLQHIIVLHDGHAYLVRIFDSHHNVLDRATLQKIFDVILSITPDQDNPAPVSVLTAGSRSIWAQAYQELIKNPENAATLQLFQQGLFVLCLDSQGGEAEGAAGQQGLALARALHGGCEEVENRWYDKHQLIVDANGVVSFNFEPSLGDRVHWARWIDDVLQIVARSPSGSAEAGVGGENGGAIDSAVVAQYMRPLTVTYGKSFVTHIRSTRQEATSLVSDTDVSPLHLPCGRAQLAGCGMDAEAFVQLCLQLAQYSLHDRLCPASALATTTSFFHGTTEVVRTATPEMQLAAEQITRMQKGGGGVTCGAPTPSEALANAGGAALTRGGDAKTTGREGGAAGPRSEVQRCLLAASARHVQLMQEAMRGEGIDRHLLALQQVAKLNMDKAALAFFEDDVYKNASMYLLRTGSFSAPWLQYYAMGPGHNRGYGVGCVVDEDEIRLSLCAFKNSPAIDVSDMRAAILTAAQSVAHALDIPAAKTGQNRKGDAE